MRLAVVVFGSVLVLASATRGFADTDCRRVNKLLEMGRTTEDIVGNSAGTISEEDIDKCKAEKPQGGTAPAEEKKDAQ